MSRHKPNTGARRDRTDLYSEITDKIIAELEADRVPWVRPWGTAAAKAPLAMPRNASTSRPYSGINVLLLWGAVIERGFAGQSWLTFRQACSLGGRSASRPTGPGTVAPRPSSATTRCWTSRRSGVMVFPGTGIQENLADKARKLGIPVWRFS